MFESYRHIFPETAAVADGELTIGGVRTSELVATYGTPVYVYDELHLRRAMARYQESFERYAGGVHVCYAAKALCTRAILELAAQLGLGIDVASGGELTAALDAGVRADRIVVHGNNKSGVELEQAVGAGVRHIVVDAGHELEMLEQVARRIGRRQSILVRVNPDIHVETHRYIRTAHAGSKFGVDSDQASTLLAVANTSDWIVGDGVHVHLGSQVLDLGAWHDAVRWLAAYAVRLDGQGIPLRVLDVGGGLGIPYTPSQTAPTIEEYADTVDGLVTGAWGDAGLALPSLVVEPGRSIAGSAGITLYTVGVLKESGRYRYVNVDGGMSDNPRPMLYQAEYACLLGNRPSEDPDGSWWIAGKHCESGDVLIEDAPLPTPRAGDVLVVAATGAYGASMASNYNAIPRPPVVFVRDGEHRLVVRRETIADLMGRDV